MVIVKITSGLGNQMFQYAFAMSLGLKTGRMVKIDIDNFDNDLLRKYELNKFFISLPTASTEEVAFYKRKYILLNRILRKISKDLLIYPKGYCKESCFHFDNKVFDANCIYYDGYWQSEKYFSNFKNKILQEFTYKSSFHSITKQIRKQIKKNNSVSLHVRRGDYIKNTHINSLFGTCSLAYYKEALSYLSSKISKLHIFVFSDDLNWSKKNLSFIKNAIFVHLDESIDDYEEMYLMSQCQHNIIANSSFSWWGAWLNQNPEKIVISPKNWFIDDSKNTKDLIPSDWIRL